jgi:hypothetical protein
MVVISLNITFGFDLPIEIRSGARLSGSLNMDVPLASKLICRNAYCCCAAKKLLLLTAISRLLAEIGRPSDHSPDPESGTALNHSSTEEGQSVSPNRSAAANRYDVVLSGFVTGQDAAAVPAVTSRTFGYLWRSSYAQFWKILSQAMDDRSARICYCGRCVVRQ